MQFPNRKHSNKTILYTINLNIKLKKKHLLIKILKLIKKIKKIFMKKIKKLLIVL